MKKIYNSFIKLLKIFRLNIFVRSLNDIRHLYWHLRFLKYFKEAETNTKSNYIKNSKNIWIFWWQGSENMPEIIKACYASAVKHANGHKVVLVTKDNYKNYTNISENIISRLKQKEISLTAFSDVMRFNLLKNNGGLWMDATMYVRDELKDEYFKDIFTVGIDDRKYHESVNGAFSIFLFGGCNNIVIDFMNNFYEIYFRNNDYIKYYFTTDVALNYCYKNNIGSFKDFVDNDSFNSDPNIHNMQNVLNEKYRDETFQRVSNRFSKLTYKMDFNDHEDTFYKRLINKEKPFV